MGPGVEGAVGLIVAFNRLQKVIRPVGIHGLGCLLFIVAGFGEITVGQSGGDFLYGLRQDCWRSDVDFTSLLMRRPHDGFGSDLRLENWRHGLRMPRQTCTRPFKLGRIECG